ncbi:3-oxoadipate enol-lactonase [Roseivivax lentus]|uniref:3-oxoadipate enol-lactonase n=1 Tax=Roseivivax lentus TaxID=633194 RepID=A0A1N7P1V9_9RHOB|nr:3-oxoadipate enol-lactonase [Roseivivax lentus]SIT04526.1 3-oxoadipate enol-lactonase [Roseivivax lentus]
MNIAADLGHVRLNYRIDGAEEAPWLILSNSLGADLSMWDDQMAVLCETYRVLRYDTRGHGGSSTPEGPYTFGDLTGDVLGLMDHLGIETASFMGLSMGGMTGLGLAIRHGARMRQVICADGRADAPQPIREMWDQRIAKVEAGGLEAIVDGTLESWLTEDWRADNPDRVAAIRRMILGNDPAGYIACCRALKGLDYLRHLPDAQAPILFLGGREDKGAAPEVMQAMAEATPGGAYIAIPDAAHLANINRPEAFNIAIADVLGLPDPSHPA